jgi:hypothetical protein
MNRKERKQLQEKLYNILHDKYKIEDALLVHNKSVCPLYSVLDFVYHNKGIIDLLRDDILSNNETEIYATFEKWLKVNFYKYTFSAIRDKADKRCNWYWAFIFIAYWVGALVSILCN